MVCTEAWPSESWICSSGAWPLWASFKYNATLCLADFACAWENLWSASAEEDEAKDGDGVLVRLEVGVGAELVGGVPEALFEFGDIGGHGWSLTGDRRRGGFTASWLLFGHGHHSYRNDQTIPPRRSR